MPAEKSGSRPDAAAKPTPPCCFARSRAKVDGSALDRVNYPPVMSELDAISSLRNTSCLSPPPRLAAAGLASSVTAAVAAAGTRAITVAVPAAVAVTVVVVAAAIIIAVTAHTDAHKFS